MLDGLVIAGLVLFPILAPGYLDLGTRIVILVLCAMSLDLLVGYCGLVTLGHAAFFGVGAYAAGIFALRASAEPVLGLLAGGAAAAVLGIAVGRRPAAEPAADVDHAQPGDRPHHAGDGEPA